MACSARWRGTHQSTLPLFGCRAGAGSASTTSVLKNREAWEIGTAGLPDAQEARNVVLSDEEVHEFVVVAYVLDHQLGLLVDTLAITGARPSQ